MIRVMFLVFLLIGTGSFARARTLEGVSLQETRESGKTRLHLNGAGLRKAFFMKIYVAGLYLPAKSKDAAAIIGAHEPMTLTMHYLRDVPRSSVVRANEDSFKRVSGRKYGSLKTAIRQMNDGIADIKAGDRLDYVYVPGKGVRVFQNGKAGKPAVAGKEFKEQLFSIWLGPDPADEDLRQELLGIN